MITQRPWPCLVGPTGVGKSEIAFQIAKNIGYEILSFDAFQVYEGLPVGTAHPPLEWQKAVRHHLVGIRNIHDPWSAGDFSRDASAILKKRQSSGKGVLLVGGSGFYLRALVEGLPPGLPANKGLRSDVQGKVDSMGLEFAHQWLRSLDPQAAERIHANDRQRICRAIEKALEPQGKSTEPMPPLLPTLLLGIECPRESLDQALMTRCKKMWEGGLLSEAKYVHSLGFDQDYPILKIIGYDEANAFLKGQWDQNQALEKMFRRTRQYAKRQWTWFRNQHSVDWHSKNPVDQPKELVELLTDKILGTRGDW